MEVRMGQVLTERVFGSSLDCMYKCHLLLKGKHGTKSEYEEHTEHLAEMYQRAAIARLREINPDTKVLRISQVTPNTLHHHAHLVIIRRVEADGLRSDSIVPCPG